MFFRQIFDEKLAQYAYLVGCQKTNEAIVIDPERDIDTYVKIAESEGLEIVAVTETHIHADFLSGSRQFAHEHGTKVYLSDEGDEDWKYSWVNLGEYDYTFVRHGDTFYVGNIKFEIVHTPGHTPEHICFLITDEGGGADEPMGVASGDFIFVGDVGRPDLLESAAGIAGLMEPSARKLYQSITSFLDKPDYLQVWPGHGAGSACGKALGAVPETTLGYERRFNEAIQDAIAGEDRFVTSILEGQPEPPYYFARMKRDNKQGPAVLDKLPTPRRVGSDGLECVANGSGTVVVDARIDRSEFMRQHVPGSIYSPFNKQFNTVVGCYVEETTPICLVIPSDDVDEAVRDLIRIGLDNIVGYITPGDLETYFAAGGDSSQIPERQTTDLDELNEAHQSVILDVRKATEFEEDSVPGAVNIAHTRLLPRLAELPTDKTLSIHCKSGARSAVAAAFLRKHGHDVVYINGEFEDWLNREAITA